MSTAPELLPLAAAERLDRALRDIRSSVNKHLNHLVTYFDREADRCAHYPHGSTNLSERLRMIALVREDLETIETILRPKAARQAGTPLEAVRQLFASAGGAARGGEA
jgi:hypothetical protein